MAENHWKRWDFRGFGANLMPDAEGHLGNVGALHAEVSAVIEYAYYCKEQANPGKGLRALRRVKDALRRRAGNPADAARAALQVIERSIALYEKNR
jgi:hypothetical protein